MILVSGLANEGLDILWANIAEHRRRMEAAGELALRRGRQQVRWMWTMIDNGFRARLGSNAEVRALVGDLEKQVAAGETSPALAAEQVLHALGS